MNKNLKMNVDELLDYSLELKKGEKSFYICRFKCFRLLYLIASQIIGKGATPFILWNDFKLNRVLINLKNEDIYKEMYDMYEKMINSCDVAIMLDNNVEEYQNISTDDILFFLKTDII